MKNKVGTGTIAVHYTQIPVGVQVKIQARVSSTDQTELSFDMETSKCWHDSGQILKFKGM